jgi:outer membrane protein TolC
MSPELKNVSAKADQAAARADAALGNFLPSLDLSVSASRSLMDMWNKQNYYGGKGKREDEKWGAGATLTIPLDFAGSAQTSIRAEKYEAAQARLISLYARRDVLSSTSQAWDMLEAAQAKINQLKSQVEAAKIAVEVVREEFLAGTKTTLEVLSAEQEYFSAQVSFIEAEQQEIMAAYELLYRMGILSAEALNLNVTVYNPDKEKVPFWGLSIEHDARLAQQEMANTNMGPWEKSL